MVPITMNAIATSESLDEPMVFYKEIQVLDYFDFLAKLNESLS